MEGQSNQKQTALINNTVFVNTVFNKCPPDVNKIALRANEKKEMRIHMGKVQNLISHVSYLKSHLL